MLCCTNFWIFYEMSMKCWLSFVLSLSFSLLQKCQFQINPIIFLVGKVIDMLSTCCKVGQMLESFETNVAVYDISYWRFLICRAYQMMTQRKNGIFHFLLHFWILCDKRVTLYKKKKIACLYVFLPELFANMSQHVWHWCWCREILRCQDFRLSQVRLYGSVQISC